MSIQFMNWAWGLPLPPVKKLILLKLADNSNDLGVSYPSVKLVARLCGVSDRTVQRTIHDFSSSNLVRIEQRFRGDGSQSSNYYTLLANLCPGDNRSPTHDIKPAINKPTQDPEGDTIVTPLTTIKPSLFESPPTSDGGLIFPLRFSLDERSLAENSLRSLPLESAQMVLDELVGRMRISEIKNPLRYLASLVSKAAAGRFTPELALGEKKRRIEMRSRTSPRQDQPIMLNHAAKAKGDKLFLSIEKNRKSKKKNEGDGNA